MTVQYRRGFKAEANRWARDLRHEQGLAPDSPMCPRKLCAYLDLSLTPLSDYATACPDQVALLMSETGQREFSAVTWGLGLERFIIYNDAHEPGRQPANIAHEVAHALLQHPIPKMLGEDGKRNHDKTHEDEANWLGPALLISDEAAVSIVSRRLSIPDAAELYGTSHQLVQMRINVSGARKRAA